MDGLNCFGSGEKTAVDSIDDGLGGNLSSTEESSIQTLDGIFTTLDSVELQVNVPCGVWI